MGYLETILKLEQLFRKWHTTADKVLWAVDWLKHYGYLAKEGTLTVDDVVKALKKLQEITGALEVDGELGPKTLTVMQSWPRCGVSDAAMLEAREAVRAWGTKNLTYFIQKRDSDLSPAEWDAIIREAFDGWERVCGLKFEQTDSNSGANLVISTGRGSKDNFDGPGSTLAWAYLPPQANFKGQLLMRFDEDETWSKFGANRGTYLLNVATHEFGHFIGLEHSSVSSALMAPFYSPKISTPQDNDDVSRAVALYGKPSGSTPTPTPTDPPTSFAAPSDLTGDYDAVEKRVVLKWKDNSTGEEGFQIYRNGALVGKIGRGIVAVSDRPTDGTYVYKVRAYKGENYSAFSNSVTVVVGTETEPEPPTQKKLILEVTGDNLKYEVKEG